MFPLSDHGSWPISFAGSLLTYSRRPSLSPKSRSGAPPLCPRAGRDTSSVLTVCPAGAPRNSGRAVTPCMRTWTTCVRSHLRCYCPAQFLSHSR